MGRWNRLVSEYRFQRWRRIRHRLDFDRVYQNEAYAADTVLVLRGCRNDLGYSRLGLSVSRRVGNAVIRNRWKRLIREAFRRLRSQLPAGYDFVVRPRRGADADAKAIQSSLPKVARRLARRLEGERA